MIHSPWTPFLYQYLVGGFFFSLAIIISLKTGYLQKNNKMHRHFIYQLVGGLFAYMAFHGLWIFWVVSNG